MDKSIFQTKNALKLSQPYVKLCLFQTLGEPSVNRKDSYLKIFLFQTSWEPSVNRKDLCALALVVPTWNNTVLAP